ncbi:hypothetical protein SDC9_169154 [bioreactor metagenome]|uniref:Uncharacterized protein n=1 Tax=bioreactor metagenome TaxID=1076179 RepID=A0A645GCP1_9ZZZZ
MSLKFHINRVSPVFFREAFLLKSVNARRQAHPTIGLVNAVFGRPAVPTPFEKTPRYKAQYQSLNEHLDDRFAERHRRERTRLFQHGGPPELALHFMLAALAFVFRAALKRENIQKDASFAQISFKPRVAYFNAVVAIGNTVFF